jgi:hypothetical protein
MSDLKQDLEKENQELEKNVTESTQSTQRSGASTSRSKLQKKTRVADDNHDLKTAGAVLGASGKSLGDWVLVSTRNMLVDIPLAATEGLRAVPSLYGEAPVDEGKVTDWKSGAIVGAKTFASGWYEGVTDMYNMPAKGAKESGALGVVTGVGKGVMNLVTKTAAGSMGLFAYPSSGITQSIRTAYRSGTRRNIAAVMIGEGEWKLKVEDGREVAHGKVVTAFETLKKGKQSVQLVHSRSA